MTATTITTNNVNNNNNNNQKQHQRQQQPTTSTTNNNKDWNNIDSININSNNFVFLESEISPQIFQEFFFPIRNLLNISRRPTLYVVYSTVPRRLFGRLVWFWPKKCALKYSIFPNFFRGAHTPHYNGERSLLCLGKNLDFFPIKLICWQSQSCYVMYKFKLHLKIYTVKSSIIWKKCWLNERFNRWFIQFD